MKRLLLVLPPLYLLVACAPSYTAPPRVVVERVAIEPGLLECRAAPELLEGTPTNEQVAEWIEELKAAHADCRERLEGVKESLPK